MTFCPGKNQVVSMTGGWVRDLTMDLETIRVWRARVLVSLMETHEFNEVGVSLAELSRQAGKLGIEWIHAPIADGSTPDDQFMGRWRSIIPRLRSVLDEGGSVVFHCLGGLGRTGTMAACLLIELGAAPPDAVTAVRTARPGAIENSRQEDFVINYKPLTRPFQTRSNTFH